MKNYKTALTQINRDGSEDFGSKEKYAAQTVLHTLILLACDEAQYSKIIN